LAVPHAVGRGAHRAAAPRARRAPAVPRAGLSARAARVHREQRVRVLVERGLRAGGRRGGGCGVGLRRAAARGAAPFGPTQSSMLDYSI
jgi:hypothetical protein